MVLVWFCFFGVLGDVVRGGVGRLCGIVVCVVFCLMFCGGNGCVFGVLVLGGGFGWDWNSVVGSGCCEC